MREWYKDAVIYAVDIKRYHDSDGDGIGDLRGLIGKLDHIASLGVNCLWLLPFYPSPQKDNGYDIVDYYGVHGELGSAGDFVELISRCQDKGIRVIIDLVINHSSDEHPWFLASRSGLPRYDDYYVWNPEASGRVDARPAFPQAEDSVWQYDKERKEYYYHTFYRFEPDLNLYSEDVLAEIERIVRFWLRLGVSGFRLDAAAPMTRRKTERPDGDRYAIFERLHKAASWERGDATIFGEVDDDPHRIDRYTRGGQGVQVFFDFTVNPHVFLALVREEAEPIVHSLRLLPVLPENCSWAFFLRNLDELNLEDLSPAGREEVFSALAPKKDQRIFGRGIRRRLAPLLGDDGARVRLAHAILFCLPGIPCVPYGDEIAMGDLLSATGRDAVRVAMQWSPERNGGFSDVDSRDVKIPTIASGRYRFTERNVSLQERSPDSFLHWFRTALHIRKTTAELHSHEYDFVQVTNKHIFCICYSEGDRRVICAHNLAKEPQRADLPAELGDAQLLLSQDTTMNKSSLALGGYGFAWLRIPERHWRGGR